MKSSFYGISIVLLVSTCCIALAAPKPAVVQGPNLWTLKTEFTQPQQIIFKRASDNKPVRFWYMIITITNNSKRDVDFFPKCELATDTLQINSAGQGVASTVFESIKERHKKKYPFLELLGTTDSRILQGEDNARDVAIIWPDFDHDAIKVNIYIAGLSNETAEVQYPARTNQDEEPKTVFLRKTLELKYNVKGDPASANGAMLEYKEKSWVMR
ncbi:MAG: hypothetical protein P8016_04750 [Sedimentisphaerales bacterium]